MTTAERLLRQKQDIDGVYEAGKLAEYDRFWDAYQNMGNREDYQNAFSGYGWDNEIFKPKYDITVKGSVSGYMLFRFARITGSLPDILDGLGIKLDMTGNSSLNYAFQNCSFTEIGECVSSSSANDQAFASASLLGIIRLFSSTSGAFTKLTNTFQNCTALKEIRFGSTIECSLDIHWSTLLSADSLGNIMEHLSDAATGFTLTLPTTAEANYDAEYGDGAWAALVATKTNWSFAYA